MKLTQIIQEGYTGYLVLNRDHLLNQIPPKFPKVIAHHITFQFPGNPDQLPPETSQAFVVGEAWDDEMGVQALVVEIEGNSIRPDGKQYHITWSLDPSKGAKPVMSNKLLANSKTNFQKIEPPIPILIQSKFFSH